MAQKPVKRAKHAPPAPARKLPQRTCVGCREILPKRTLIRIVRTAHGVEIDPTGKLAGRGAYLHNKRSCWERGLKGAVAHALKAELTGEEIQKLKSFLAALPEEAPEEM